MMWLVGVVLLLSSVMPASGGDIDLFPSYEPFLASRMAGFVFSRPTPDALTPQPGLWKDAEAVEELRTGLAESSRRLEREVAEEVDGPDAAERVRRYYEEEQRDMVDPSLSSAKAPLWSAVPPIVAYLGLIWPSPEWTPEERRLATAVGDFLADYEPDLRFDFASQDRAANDRALRRMVDWFRATALDPKRQGYMIYNMDDGPWSLKPLDGAIRCVVTDTVWLSPSKTVQICRTDESRWGLIGAENGSVLWTRFLSRVPAGDFFMGTDPVTPLGPYGWRVDMSFGELTHAYIGADFQPNYYFTSW